MNNGLMRVASEKYGTSVMKDEECILFFDVCLDSGLQPEIAFKHMRIIDTLLYAEKLECTAGKLARKTTSGFYRKNSNFNFTMNKILEGAVNGAFD